MRKAMVTTYITAILPWLYRCKHIVCLCLVFFAGVIQAKAGVKFIQNMGQWDANVLYRADIPGGAFFLEKDRITYYFYDGAALHAAWHDHKKIDSVRCHVVRITFPGQNSNTQFTATNNTPEYYNYFIGNDRTRWVSHAAAYHRLLLKNMWPGIDMEIRGYDDQIKYNFIVHPHADASRIKMKYDGAKDVTLENNILHIYTSLAQILEQEPVASQTGRSKNVNASYKLNGTTVGFNVGSYNHRDTLVIDPLVIFATFSGSYADNFGFTGTYDSLGYAYSGGTAFATGFPVTTGAFQMKFGGGTTIHEDLARDAAILKYSPDGSKLIWATYLGGSSNEQPHSMIVNKNNELLILGTTFSQDFPMGPVGYNRSYNGNGDIFITRFSEDGTALLSSTFMGGSSMDGLNGNREAYDVQYPLAYNYGDNYRGEIMLDKKGNVMVASCTQSVNFPVLNAFQPRYGGGALDGCVFELTPDLSKLLWSSFLGGTLQDAAYGINVDSKNNIFVCGGTQSADLKLVGSPATGIINGERDGFIYKISSSGALLGGTYVGTEQYDQCYFVQLDNFDRVYVAGQTLGNFPVSRNVYSNLNGRQFIARYTNDLHQLDLSTVFGSGRSSVDISPSAFLVDLCGRICVSGWGGAVNSAYYNSATGNTYNLPVTSDAYQRTTDGSDFYLIILGKDMNNLVYASYFGGPESLEHVDGGTSRFDKDGKVYQSVCGGCGGYSDFPTTANAYSRKNNGRRPNDPQEGGCNNAFFKLDLNSSNYAPTTRDTLITVFANDTINYHFDIVDPDKGDSVYVKVAGTIFDGKKMPQPAAIFKADSGINTVHASLYWATNCNHISTDTYTVRLTMRDNGCPTPRSNTRTIRIVVKPVPLPDPPAVFCIQHAGQNTVIINWGEFNLNKYTSRYVLAKIYPDGHRENLMDITNPAQKTYKDGNAPDNLTQDFHYYIYGLNICDERGDSTRKAGTLPDKDSIPHNVDIFTATVEQNKNIRVMWKQYQKNDFHYYIVYRRENKPGAPYLEYEMLRKETDTSILDTEVNVQAMSYCYKVVVENQCGYRSGDGNEGCTILLTGISIPFEHHLSWSAYRKWNGNVENYFIHRRDPATPDDTIGKVNGGSLAYIDNKLNYDQGLYWYHVEAKEGPTGDGAISVSNEIKLIQAPLLYVPTAFTPNGDSLNDTWKLVPVFVKDFHLKVFNRWGEFVWETNNKKDAWNGIYKNIDPFNNVFIWQVDYTGWDESHNYQKGNVTIIR